MNTQKSRMDDMRIEDRDSQFSIFYPQDQTYVVMYVTVQPY